MIALLAALLVMPAADSAKLIQPGKPTVVHFFASWCGACAEEFPRVRKTLLSLPARGVHVQLASIDRPEDERAAAKMLSDFRLTKLPAVLIDAPEPDPVMKAMGDPKWEGTLPATFLFDSRGRLVRSFLGETRVGELEKAVRELR
jgi:thiol-disulfide isomerase/thioredoxin